MSALEIQQLSKRFGSHVVLSEIQFSVEEGEFFVLLGPSGGGKSTILKLISGIESPDSGRILLNGRDITALPPRQRNVGMVFQDYGLYPHMNVFENIAYGLEARGMPKDEITRRVQDSAAKLGLTPLLTRIVVDLSGGEQQRVALARALAKDADVYLFDEPLSNLDPKLRAQARRDILMVHRAKGKPSLYVTHDQAEALAIADRIGIIAHGRLQQVGTPDDLLQRPANVFVAGFLGSPPMNLLRVRLRRAETHIALDTSPDTLLHLLPSHQAYLNDYAKSSLILGIPPTALYLPGSPHPDEFFPAGELNGVIESVEPLIGEAIVTLQLNNRQLLTALFRDVDETRFQPGQTLTLLVDASVLRFFDPDTEQAIVP